MGGDSRKNSTLLGKCFSKYKIQKLWKENASQNTEYKNSGEEVYLKIQNMPPCSLCSPIDHNPNMCSSEQRKLETRSSWVNCALRDEEAVYWVSVAHYEAVSVGI